MKMNKKTINPHRRAKARRLALQALYQWHITQQEFAEIKLQFLESAESNNADVDYFQRLLDGIAKEYIALDDAIRPHLDRSLDEIGAIELAILRLSTFELCHLIDVPYKIVIDEGIQLAKKFGSEDSYKFINKVLDSLAKQYRTQERD